MKRERITVRDFAFGGEAVGRLADGRICFVRGAVPGEEVEGGIVSEHRRFCRAKLLDVLRSSPERRRPDCPFFADCPGCSYRHVPYHIELEAKTRQLDSFLNRNRAEKTPLLESFGAPSRDFWRNRLRFHADGDGRFGYRAEDNETLVEIDRCLLATEKLNAKIAEIAPPTGFRGTFALDECAERGAVCTFDADAPERLTGALSEFGRFGYRRGGFFQTNEAVASELCRRVRDCVKKFAPEFLLELFCGVGVFSLIAAETLGTLRSVGVESGSGAVREAVRNARARDLAGRCSFFCGDAADAPARFAAFVRRFRTLAVVDPPRTGLGKKLTGSLCAVAPDAILYVSCGADTLRRDLDELAPVFRAEWSALLDMFPATAHFESLTMLRRKGASRD